MQPNGRSFSKEDLIAEVISKNIPAAWEKDFKMFKLHLKTRIKDILSELTVIEEQVKIHPKNNENPNKKHMKNPCRLHGTHEWDECRQNLKNNKTNVEKDKTDRNKSDVNNQTREHRCTKERHSTLSTHCSRSSSRSSKSDTSDEYHCLENKENTPSTPSSEILIAIPDTTTSRKYTTYLGLVDSGSSGSLINKNIVKSFPVQTALKKTKWETATGILETKGTTTIEKCRLPQFTKNRAISSTFHLFDKHSTDTFDVILGRDLLQAIGMDIHYSTKQFVWDNISIDMVPSGYWTKDKISSVAKTWNEHKEIQLTEILPAVYQPAHVSDIAKQQTHLTSEEQSQLHTVLLDFQDLFLGQCGKFTGEPVTLELIPDAKPFYAKPFALPRAYEQTTKNEIKRLESLGILTQVKASQ
jgi:hypothetical protein